MLESVRKAIPIPEFSVSAVASVSVVGAFLALLAEGQIHPFAIYLLKIYLAF